MMFLLHVEMRWTQGTWTWRMNSLKFSLRANNINFQSNSRRQMRRSRKSPRMRRQKRPLKHHRRTRRTACWHVWYMVPCVAKIVWSQNDLEDFGLFFSCKICMHYMTLTGKCGAATCWHNTIHTIHTIHTGTRWHHRFVSISDARP